jgi:hypothetical protein
MLDPTKLADKIKADLLTEAEDSTGLKLGSFTKCLLCRAGFVYRGPNGDNSGRFCSDRCRELYDSGLRYRPVSIRYADGNGQPMRPTDDGFRIVCRSCGVQFESKGLVFCSDDCRQLSAVRKEAKAAGYEPRQGRMCMDCNGRIPRYTPSGRATKSTAVRCSACQRKATRVVKGA